MTKVAIIRKFNSLVTEIQLLRTSCKEYVILHDLNTFKAEYNAMSDHMTNAQKHAENAVKLMRKLFEQEKKLRKKRD